MLARLVTAIGVVAAAVGLTLYGMATSYANYHQDLGRFGVAMMVAGAIATVLGGLWYRSQEKAAEAAMAARERR
jgi:hypothetical protein